MFKYANDAFFGLIKNNGLICIGFYRGDFGNLFSSLHDWEKKAIFSTGYLKCYV